MRPMQTETTSPSSSPPWDRRDAFALTFLAVLIAIPLRGLMVTHGPTMEEGFMLTFPELVMHGAVPNRDFLHLYGPGGLWVLAAVYKVFGVTLATERVFGLIQHIAVITAVYWLIRRWGRSAATVAATMVIFINLATVGLAALAWNGAIAFGAWSLWAALNAREDPRRRWLIGSGLLVSMALLYRPDLILALSLGLVAALWGIGWRRIRSFAIGLSLAVVGYLAQAAMAGPVNAFKGMVIEPVFDLRAGRSLPMPPEWSHLSGYFQKAAALRTVGWPFPGPGLSQQLYLWFVLTLLAPLITIAVSRWARTRDNDPRRPHALLVLGLFGLGLSSQALQRVDQTHLSWVSCISIATLSATVAQVLIVRTARNPLWSRVRFAASTGLVALFILVVLTPQYTVRGYSDVANQSIGRYVFGYSINRGDRNFYVPSPSIANAGQEAVDQLARDSKPGERLFVGPVDLRYTPYADSFFYYLFPELKPATYFIEVDPFDSKPGSRLASDVASADWLLLSNVWNGWKEPNSSSIPGSDVPNQIVKAKFCRVGNWGIIDTVPIYELYKRCDKRSAP